MPVAFQEDLIRVKKNSICQVQKRQNCSFVMCNSRSLNWGEEGLTRIEGGGETENKKKMSNCQNKISQVEELLKIKCSRKGVSYVIDRKTFSEEQKYDKLFLCWNIS